MNGYFEAIESFDYVDPYRGPDRIIAGSTIVSAEAHAYRERPAAFRPTKRAGDREPRTLRATAAAKSLPWPQVVTSPHVQAAFRELALGWDGREHGRWLVARDGDIGLELELEIVAVVGHAYEEDRRSDSVARDLRQAAFVIAELPKGDVISGDVHSHPPNETVEPSTSDLRAWSVFMDQLGRDHWLGVIVSCDDRGGSALLRPRYSATLLRRSGTRIEDRAVAIELKPW